MWRTCAIITAVRDLATSEGLCGLVCPGPARTSERRGKGDCHGVREGGCVREGHYTTAAPEEATRLLLMAARLGFTDEKIADVLRKGLPKLNENDNAFRRSLSLRGAREPACMRCVFTNLLQVPLQSVGGEG